MSDEENIEVVRRVTDVMDAEGFEAALPVFLEAAHPDVEWREDPAWPASPPTEVSSRSGR
jgi:hypothetical protein